MNSKKLVLVRTLVLLTLCLSMIGLVGYTIQVDRAVSTLPTLSRNGSRGEEVRKIQQRLSELGLYNGSVDGIYGSGTEKAVQMCIRDRSMVLSPPWAAWAGRWLRCLPHQSMTPQEAIRAPFWPWQWRWWQSTWFMGESALRRKRSLRKSSKAIVSAAGLM